MLQAGKLSWIGLLAFAFCACIVAYANPTDEDRDYYENRRVARITVTRGDVQIRRSGQREWEEAAQNVPLLEGDRLATGENSRVEIQFNNRNYLRIDENSLLQVVTLRNEGVALSLPEGSASLRLSDFKKEREYFEIDAPQTTIAARREGLYRIDAPRERGERDVIVTVTGGGEARVYTENSGFAIRNGRQARIFLEDDDAGDFELTAARSFSDDFDRWTADREERLSRRHSDYAYYDPQIYGADELYDYGDWIYTNDYGYVWRPYQSAIASYRDWSPYRYGHWRYLPAYGWTWIADEPWGWATSHYGRWIYIDGYWHWCPYDSWRSRKIFWQPSLAIFINFGRNVCWYPMPYNYGYKYVNKSKTIIYNTTVINNNPPVTQPIHPSKRIPLAKQAGEYVPPEAYAKAVSGVPIEEFGKGRNIARTLTLEQAKGVVRTPPIIDENQLPKPPISKTEIKVEKEREIVGKRETFTKAERDLDTGKIGAAQREKGMALDEKLRDNRVFVDRKPVTGNDTQSETNNVETANDKRRTGVFDRRNDLPVYRPEDRKNDDRSGDVDRPAPRPRNSQKSDDERPVNRPEKREDTPPIYQPQPQRPNKRDEDNDSHRPPIYMPQPRNEPRPEPRREEPRYEPPPRHEEPRPEPPKQRDEPRNDPPKQRDEPAPAPPPRSKSDKDGLRK